MSRPTTALIDLAALRHNYHYSKQLAPHSRVVAVLKANAYGHGAVPVAQALYDADAFAVACAEEGLQLRYAGLQQPIVLLEGFFHADELKLLCDYDLQVVIHNPQQLQLFCAQRLPLPVTVWLKIDTGMHRLGFQADEFPTAYQQLLHHRNVAKLILTTHFACADELDNDTTQRQIDLFNRLTQGLPHECSLANSPATLGWTKTRRDWVRPGLMLYGISPFAIEHPNAMALRPVMTLQSELIAVKAVIKGESVGYGGSWTAQEDTRIGIVAVGYGDGYPRHAPSGTPVWINDQQVGLLGRVAMDMIAVDLRQQPHAQVGDKVVLWGKPLNVAEVAQWAGTIPYQLLTGISLRVRFQYA